MATEQTNRLDVDEPLLVLPLPPKPSTYSTAEKQADAEIEHLRQRGREMAIYAQRASSSPGNAEMSRVASPVSRQAASRHYPQRPHHCHAGLAVVHLAFGGQLQKRAPVHPLGFAALRAE